MHLPQFTYSNFQTYIHIYVTIIRNTDKYENKLNAPNNPYNQRNVPMYMSTRIVTRLRCSIIFYKPVKFSYYCYSFSAVCALCHNWLVTSLCKTLVSNFRQDTYSLNSCSVHMLFATLRFIIVFRSVRILSGYDVYRVHQLMVGTRK